MQPENISGASSGGDLAENYDEHLSEYDVYAYARQENEDVSRWLQQGRERSCAFALGASSVLALFASDLSPELGASSLE